MTMPLPPTSGLKSAFNEVLRKFDAWEKVPGEDSSGINSGGIMEESKRHPSNFRNNLLRNNGGTAVLIGPNLDPWQKSDFEAMDDSWLYAAGLSNKRPQKRRAYLERPRGHSKTTDEAIMACWIVMAAPHLVRGYACAAGEEQAKLLIEAAEMLVADNPWLGELIKVQSGAIINPETRSECQVIPAKSNTNFGHVPNFVICDELTHWQFKKVWTAIFSGMHKVPTSILIVISNAGTSKGRSWQWKLREAFRVDPAWYFHSLNGQQASWILQEDIDEASRLLDSDDFRRLIRNEWIVDSRRGVQYADLQRAKTLPGPCQGKYHGCEAIIGGLDVGLRHDRTSLVWLGVDVAGKRLKLLGHRSWNPKDFGGRLELAEVESAIMEDFQSFGRVDALYADDWQSISTLQRLADHFRCVEVNFSSKEVRPMAKLFLDAFQSGWLSLFPDEILERDILSIDIETNQVTRSKRLVATRDEAGHADSGFALAIAILFGKAWLEDLSMAGGGEASETVEEPVDLG